MDRAVEVLGWEHHPTFPVPNSNGETDHGGVQFHTDSKKGTLWSGRTGQYRTRLLHRMIWLIKNEIFMDATFEDKTK
ncbi:MAG: hypothetical protein ACK5LG_21835 [Bacteroides thetaiotaomicron]